MRRSYVIVSLCFLLSLAPLDGQQTGADPSLGAGFRLDRGGSITQQPGEVISGRQSIKGEQFGSATFQAFLRTLPDTIPFAAGQSYKVTFRYTILDAGDRGFETLFFSPTGARANNFVPSVTVGGAAGSTGTGTLISTLGNFSDYEVRWNVVSKGAIVIDEIRISEERTGIQIATEDAEGPTSRIQLAQAFLPPVRVGQSVLTPLVLIGGRPPYRWTTSTTAPPAGLQIDAGGTLSGRAQAAGTYQFDGIVTDATGTMVRLVIRQTVLEQRSLPAPDPLTVSDGLAIVRPREYDQPFRNPLGGLRPHMNDVRQDPYASLTRQYIQWNLIERNESDGVDRIRQVTDGLFADLPRYNLKVVPRVYLIWPEPMARYWPSDLTPDDYSSQQFRERMKRLIARLGEVWNNDPRIAFIETGIIGYWGEQHSPRFSALPREVEREMGDAFRDAFPDKLLMNRYPDDFVDYPFGIHWDVFGSIVRDNSMGNFSDAISAALQTPRHLNKWKTAPRGGEIAPDFLGQPDWSQASKENAIREHAPRLIELIRTLHWNHLDVSGQFSQSDQDVVNKVGQIQKALGYRFVIDEAKYTAAVSPDGQLSVELKVRNAGSSPLYYSWPLEVAVHEADTRRVVWRSTWDGIDVRTWLPGETTTLSRTFTLPGELSARQYAVSVSILDPAGMLPSVRFANVNYWNGGRTPLGPLSIGGQAPASQLNDFDDLQSDRSLYYVR